jgi:hypothetical protein
MAVYSARLAGATTLLGLVFSIASLGGSLVVPLVVTIGVLAWSTASWSRTRRIWSEPAARAYVVATVASG